jgi:hypothetical protein
MPPARQDFQHAAADTVHKPMYILYAPTPKAGQLALSRLRLSDTVKVSSFCKDFNLITTTAP